MNAILWIVGASLASFFGVLAWLMYREPVKRSAAGLLRDFRAMVGLDYDRFPVLVALTAAELGALKTCHVGLPRRPREMEKHYALPVTVPELLDLHRVVMELAQERINRAARRQQACLSGTALALGTLAGHLHQLVLVHCSGSLRGEGVTVPLESGQPRPAPEALN